MQDTMEFRRKGLLAAALYLVTVLAVGGAMWGFIWNGGARRPDMNLGDSAATRPSEDPVIAGTGAALPLLRHLVKGWRQRGGKNVHIAPSIGSGGGLAALRDGVIDCAIVSRKLGASETVGRVVQRLAMAPVVLAGGRDVAVEEITLRDLLRLVRHTGTLDSSALGFVLREPGDSAQEVLTQGLPGLAEALSDATAAKSWTIAFTDADMERILLEQGNLLGVFDLGTIQLRSLPLKVVSIDGATEAFYRPFTLICHEQHRLSEFLEYITTAAVQKTMRTSGYFLEVN